MRCASLLLLAVRLSGALIVVGCSAGESAAPPPPAPPVSLKLLVAPSLTAGTLQALQQQPVIQLVDAGGKAAAGAASITASVVSGNGAAVSGSTAVTDAQGRAAFSGLTLGALAGKVGLVSVQFSAPGLNPVSAEITISCAVLPATIGQAVLGSLSVHDCANSDGSFRKRYALVTSASTTALRIRMEGNFKTAVYAKGPNEPVFYWGLSAGDADNSAEFILLTPAGTTHVLATSKAGGDVGNFTLMAQSVPESLGCVFAYFASPLSTNQSLATTDCADSGYYGDFFSMGLPAGASVTATMGSTAFSPYLAVWQDSPNVNKGSGTGPTSAAVSYTNTTGTSQVFYLYAGSNVAGKVGAYTLSATVTYPSAVSAPFENVAIGPKRERAPPARSTDYLP